MDGRNSVRPVSPWYMNSNVVNPSVTTFVSRSLINAPTQLYGRKFGVTQWFEITQRGERFADMLFVVETAGVADAARFQDVSDIADTLVTVKVRMVNKAAETILRDNFKTRSKGDSVSTVWTAAFQPISAAKGIYILSST